jgi:S-layer protein (TIGR01567 family)
MKKLATIMLTSLALMLATVLVVGALEIRGEVATGDFTWNPQNFAGFYYDVDKDTGNEQITTTITEGNKLVEPTGVQYTSTAQKQAFKFKPWGFYNVIGFMAAPYFAGYVLDENMPADDQRLYAGSTDYCSLCNEQLEKILINNKDEKTVTSGTPLKLEEGYELGIKSIDIDGNKVFLELTKDGQVISSKVISPSKDGATMADKTFTYKKTVGDQKDLVIIGVHFKNAFRGADMDLATIDGVWQISDTATEVKVDTGYGKMRIATVTADTITMDNKDNTITLSKNKNIDLIDPDVKFMTADANELRYYLYKDVQMPGEYQIRGSVATADFTWNPQNFAGFYYDIDDDVGTEQLTTTITEGNKLVEPTGIQYTTTAQKQAFKFKPWGFYNVIGFNAAPYFAGYVLDETMNMSAEDQRMYAGSTDYCSLCNEQLEKILINNKDEKTLTSGTPLKLEEGYELGIKSIDIDGNKVFLELTKDGQVVSSKVISPSKDGATMADKTFTYKKTVGDQKDLVIIGVHFKNAFRGADQDLATVDGIWQISDTATEVKVDTEYGKMRIATVSADTITMDNKDNTITLSKNKKIDLMEGVMIQTADADTLRYYIYKLATITAPGAVEAVKAEAVKAEAVAVAAPAVNVTNVTEVKAEAEKKVTEAKKNVTEVAKNVTAPAAAPAKKGMPGFEGIFAITGLMAIAYLVLGRKR